ncbi:MAG: PadR family transcriptional regulator [Firmicutes bacterium]|nr:PadR family transcriptional regulator [Bacillota bacterium]
MSLKHGILGLLNYGAMTGYELDKTFKDSLAFFWQAQTSQIYRELGNMERNGWLTSERVVQDERPNKRVYSITDKGKAELNDWLSSPDADIHEEMRERSAFLMRVFFAGEMDSGQVLEMFRKYRRKCLDYCSGLGAADEVIAQYGAAVAGGAHMQYWKITALFGETHYRSRLEWADRAIEILEGNE